MAKIEFRFFFIAFLVLQFSANAQLFIQAEEYMDMGGVATESCTDHGAGMNVGWIDTGDWLEYEINIPISGDYVFNVRAASLNGGGILKIIGNDNSSIEMNIPRTGSWQNWQSVEGAPISFNKGTEKIRLFANTGGFNLNWFEIRLFQPEDTNKPTAPIIVDSHSDVHSLSITWKMAYDTTTLISGYKIFNQGNFLGFASDSSFQLSKLPPEKEFNLSIVSCDIAGHQSDPVQVTISTMPIEWQLAWFDEFDGNEVDRTKWNFEVGGDGWGNGEAQYYTNGSNSSVKDGYLIIEARKENYSNNRYTSSRMNNGGKGSFLYGRVEVKAKLPRTGGTWPAIWTLPTDWIYGNWPDCGEIDIMEHRGNYLNYVFGTIHTGAYNHVDGTAKSGGKMFSDVVNTFHIYALEWYPDHLDWYYDDELIFTFENEYKTFAEWPYDIKHHVMLNLAIGGGLGGNIDYNGVWPQQMIVDYVRIYDFNLGAGDTIPPTVPTNLTANVSGITANLSWEIASDNNYVDRYLIFQNGELIDSVSGSQYEIKYLEPLTAYTYSVQAKDFGGNYSEKANITFSTEEIESLSVPGKFEAEDYLYMEGMQQESCTDAGGGVNLAYIDAGDWVEYSINVIQSGDYILDVRAASLNSKGKFQLLNEDHQVLTAVETPVTGGWQTWRTTSSKSFHLNKGIQRIKIIAQAKEFNLNWFSILDNTSTAISKNLFHGDDLIYPNPFDGKELTIQLSKRTNNTEVSIHDIEQRIVFMKVYKNAEKQITLNNLNLKSGIYIMNIKRENDVSVYKLIVD